MFKETIVIFKEDYLKVVEEKEELERNLEEAIKISNLNVIEADKRIKEKDELIKKLSSTKIFWEKEYDKRLKEKDEEISELKEKHNEILIGRDEEIEKLRNINNNQMVDLMRKNEEMGRLQKEKDYYLGVFTQSLNLSKSRKEELKKKDEEIEKYKEENMKMIQVIEGKQRTIDFLNEIIEKEEKEETWTLSYSYYDREGNIKQYKQSGLLKDEYEEMYGMDSDNWISHSLVKDRKEVK